MSAMRKMYLAPTALAVLFCVYGIATAQNSPRTPVAPLAPGVTHTENPTPSDPSQPAKAEDPEMPTAGHDDATGKDVITPDSTPAAKANTPHPEFRTLDINNRGYLTADDIKANKWLSANFARCDADHDGHLSQQEYANCK
jgi:hypothetical protein